MSRLIEHTECLLYGVRRLGHKVNLIEYCQAKKSWPILYSNLLYRMGQDFLDIPLTCLRGEGGWGTRDDLWPPIFYIFIYIYMHNF